MEGDQEVRQPPIMEVRENAPVQTSREMLITPAESVESILERSKAQARELRELNEANTKLLEKMERFRAEEILRGKSEAGIIIAKAEETAAEYATRIMKGRLK